MSETSSLLLFVTSMNAWFWNAWFCNFFFLQCRNCFCDALYFTNLHYDYQFWSVSWIAQYFNITDLSLIENSINSSRRSNNSIKNKLKFCNVYLSSWFPFHCIFLFSTSTYCNFDTIFCKNFLWVINFEGKIVATIPNFSLFADFTLIFNVY